jgi:hypothetical protein
MPEGYAKHSLHSLLKQALMRLGTSVWLLSLVLLWAACSKDTSMEKNENGTADSASYQPVSAGSTWHYHDAQEGDFTLTATDQDTTIEGILFHRFTNIRESTGDTLETLFAQQSQNYYMRGLISSFASTSLLYLKDTTVNATWSQTATVDLPGGIGSVPTTIQFTLAEVDASREVNGKTYTQVAHVETHIQVFGQDYAAGDWYFARGVGLIALSMTSGGSTVAEVSLDSYSIK